MRPFNITKLVDAVKPCTLNYYHKDNLDCFYIQADNGHGYHLGFHTDKDYTDTYLPTLKEAAEHVLSLRPILPDHTLPTEYKFNPDVGGFEVPYTPGPVNHWGKSMQDFWPEYFGFHKGRPTTDNPDSGDDKEKGL